ncbi:MAG: DUF2232 domain-containing protein [Alphaproteobacteria bacterium]
MFTPKQWLMIAGGGALSALLFVAPATGNFGGLLFAYFCQLPLFLIGLGLGTAAGAIATAIAGAGFAVLGGSVGFFVFLAFFAVPVVLLVRQALLSRQDEQGGAEWYPAGLLAAWATCYGLCLLAVACLWIGMSSEGLEASVQAYFAEVMNAVAHRMGAGSDAQQANLIVSEGVVSILPGLVALSWLVVLIVNGALSQGLLTRFGVNLRPSPNFGMMELPSWLTVIAAILLMSAIILPGAFGYFATNAALLVALPFLLVGVAIAHVLAGRVSAGPLLLILFYFLLLMSKWLIVLVAFLGLIEQMAGIRQRLAHAGEED